MIELKKNYLNQNYIKGIKRREELGDVKFYFTDRTAKCFSDDTETKKIIKKLQKEFAFIQIDNDYINPIWVKGFEKKENGQVKIYFPDATAILVNLDDDSFEDLVLWFNEEEE